MLSSANQAAAGAPSVVTGPIVVPGLLLPVDQSFGARGGLPPMMSSRPRTPVGTRRMTALPDWLTSCGGLRLKLFFWSATGGSFQATKCVLGPRLEHEAHDQFFFSTVGNPDALTMTLNGIKIPVLGKHGRTVHKKTFDREWLKSHSAAPEGAQTTP